MANRKTLNSASAKNEPDVQLGVEAALHGIAAIQELRREPALANINLRSINVYERQDHPRSADSQSR